MPDIQKPIPFPELSTKPDLSARPSLSDDMQQTLSLMTGFDGQQRKIVGVSASGAVYVTSPPVKGIVNVEADQAAYDWNGSDIECSEIMVCCNCKNVGDVWVNVNAAAAVDTGKLLEAGQYVVWTIKNLKNLHIHIPTNGEKAAVIYCY